MYRISNKSLDVKGFIAKFKIDSFVFVISEYLEESVKI